MENALKRRDTAGNENTGLLKILAILTMIVDHVGAAIFNHRKYIIFRCIGRLAMPLFCWSLVVGVCKTRNHYRYALRILLVGIVSQPFYMLALGHTWDELNVYATLFCGLFALIGIREKRYFSHLWAPILALLVAHFVKMDYGAAGVLFIIVLYFTRKNKWLLAAAVIGYCIYWWQGEAFYKWLMMQLFNQRTLPKVYVRDYFVWAILSLPLIVIPMSLRFRMPKIIGYAAYPLHLLIIYLVDHFLLLDKMPRLS